MDEVAERKEPESLGAGDLCRCRACQKILRPEKMAASVLVPLGAAVINRSVARSKSAMPWNVEPVKKQGNAPKTIV